MTTRNMINGLELLEKYRDKPGYDAGAEHDVLYAYPPAKALTEDDITKMISLGWHQEHDERDYEEDYSISDYRQSESWVFYT